VQARFGAGPSAAATALLAHRRVTGRWASAGMLTRMHLTTGRLREWRVKRCSSAAASLAAFLTRRRLPLACAAATAVLHLEAARVIHLAA
jgi:hypothetical protein